MASESTAETLTSDIQQALQHAVVEVNNAFSGQEPPKKKKKKKRSREEDGQVETGTGDGELKEKKRRKKKHHQDQEVVDEQTLEQPTTVEPQVAEHKKKKKKKDKGKQTETEVINLQTQDPMQCDESSSGADAQASTAAFLSALVAAAAATPDQQMAYPPQPDPFYPPMQYGYAPGQFPQQQQGTLFPTPPVTQFSDASYGSNDDVLRAIQSLDVTKIANVLKTLGDAAAAASNAPFGGQPMPPPQQGTSFGHPSTMYRSAHGATKQQKPKIFDPSLPAPENYTTPNHAHLLANKWMNVSKLAELVRTEGLVYKKGKFSAIEDHHLKQAIENYRVGKQLGEEQIHEIIFNKNEKNKDNAFWSEITAAVPQRPIIAVYHHIRRSFHPMKGQGKWMPSEDQLLEEAVATFGQQWEKVSSKVGRMSSDCRDRYRNHIVGRDVRINGHWTKEEEDRLTDIVVDMTVKQGKDADNDVFWGRVSELMGNTRGRQQCRIKWIDSLSKDFKADGTKTRWSQQDAYILVHKVDSLNVRDDTEIDWKTLSDPQWNLWSAHSLQRRWMTMKRSIKGYEEMNHQEIMDILRVKKAQLPIIPATGKKRKERKVTSAAAVADTEWSKDTGTDVPEAGPSNGPGTIANADLDDESSSDIGTSS